MRPESLTHLADILKATDNAIRFMVGKSVKDLRGDDLLRSAIYFQFIVIGEACARLRKTEPEVLEQLSEYRRIIGFRNQIAHGHDKLDDEVTWRIVEQKLPRLRDEVEAMLRAAET